jgi:hypothetical protein
MMACACPSRAGTADDLAARLALDAGNGVKEFLEYRWADHV